MGKTINETYRRFSPFKPELRIRFNLSTYSVLCFEIETVTGRAVLGVSLWQPGRETEDYWNFCLQVRGVPSARPQGCR